MPPPQWGGECLFALLGLRRPSPSDLSLRLVVTTPSAPVLFFYASCVPLNGGTCRPRAGAQGRGKLHRGRLLVVLLVRRVPRGARAPAAPAPPAAPFRVPPAVSFPRESRVGPGAESTSAGGAPLGTRSAASSVTTRCSSVIASGSFPSLFGIVALFFVILFRAPFCW